MPIITWLLAKLTSKIALPLLAVLLVTNVASGAALFITRHTLANRTTALAAQVKANAADRQTWEAATAKADADDEKHAAQVATLQAQIHEESSDAIKSQSSAAHASVAQWVRNHAAPAQGGSGQPPLPGTANPASGADSTPTAAIVSTVDLDACAQDYVIAKGWQEWWAKVQPTLVDTASISIVPAPHLMENHSDQWADNDAGDNPYRDTFQHRNFLP